MSINDDMINMAYLRGMQVPQQTATELQRLLELTRTSEREGWRYADKLEQERKRLQDELEALRARFDALVRDVDSAIDSIEAQEWAINHRIYGKEMLEKALSAARKEAP